MLRRGRVKLSWLFNMAIAEFMREDTRVTITDCVPTNADLLEIIRRDDIDHVYLFRAGLIINKKVLESGIVVLNTHCARIPDYSGLGAIPRSLKAGDYEQVATLHHVTETIETVKSSTQNHTG